MLGEHHKHSTGLAKSVGLAVRGVLLRSVDCGNRSFESL